jgi:hypothetical protein
MNYDKEPELKAFFEGLKEKNRELPIPEFPQLFLKKSINWWIPLGVAATLVLGFFFLMHDKGQPQSSTEVLIITLEEGHGQELQFHIEETTEMDIWESPTAYLLTEF